ncbi:MAG: Serine/threonine protein kinase [Labilithrix sp.]|nr:Serine/threonine protein kinase [Labilithrix sp.]
MGASLLRSDYGRKLPVVEVGQVISSKYKLLRLLGDGGMGSVYEAEHLRLGTHVAIKVLHSDLARRSGLIERFLQEARVSAQIRSPHVVHVTDVESTPEGVAYLVMELLQGEPLSTLEKRERTLPVATASEYTLQILQALEAAHSLGVVHRDLKPDNVFVTFEGGKPVIKLIDFGIAKLKRAEGATGAGHKNLTVAGMLMGTPEYMAPEQAYSATDVDARADLYSVGVMLYEMLSGQTPAQGEDPRVVVLKVERGEVQPLVHVAPNVQPELAGLVHRAMAPRPEMRFSSAAEMRIALDAVMTGKRAGTAKIPQASVVPSPGSPGAGGAGPRGDLRTGTVMGAPAEGALVANHGSGPPPADPNAQRPGTGTARAAPIDPHALHMAQQQHAYGSDRPGPIPDAMTNPPPRGGRPQHKSGAGLIIALAIVALLLGAGAVVAYVMGTATPTPVAIEPLPTVTTLTTPATTTAPPITPPTNTGTAPPLTPPPPQTAPTPPKPHPSGSAAPKPSGSAAPPPSNAIPPFPPFPSAIPVPSGFPSSFPIPSGFPTFQVPSGFPTFPPPPAPPPG